MPVTLLRAGVEDGIVHPLMQPQLAVSILVNLVHVVVAKRHGVLHVLIEGAKTVAIITVQTVWRTNPHKAFCIAMQAKNAGVRQPVPGVETEEFHIWNFRP